MKHKLGIAFLTLFCLTAVLSTTAAFRAQAQTDGAANQPLAIYGTIKKDGSNRLLLTRKDGEAAGQDIVLTISDETKILDAVNGYPVSMDQLSDQELVYAYIGPAVTMSLPPIGNAEMILCRIPADFKVPEYITVDKLTLNSDNTSGSILASNGTTYTVSATSQILPYLTRNIVTLADLGKGRTCLIWSKPNSNEAYKIVAFPLSDTAESGESAKKTGWTQDNGIWYYYGTNGALHTGWLLLDEDWYYLDSQTGAMQTGFVTLEGKTYYLQGNGKMLTAPKTFTPDSNGELH